MQGQMPELPKERDVGRSTATAPKSTRRGLFVHGTRLPAAGALLLPCI
jgi:hypothetical protein